MTKPSSSDEITHKLLQLLDEARNRDLSVVAQHEPERLPFLLAARLEYDLRKGGFAQLLYNMNGAFLPDLEDMLIAAKAPVAHEYYVRAIQTCLANKPEYARFLASNYSDNNSTKDALHLLSIDYFSRHMPFALEGAAWLMSAHVARARGAQYCDQNRSLRSLGVMKTVYHLRQNTDAIAHMQRASLESGPIGLRITHGLIGSPDWWSKVESGVLALQSVRGKVSGFWPGQWCDGPAEFEVQTSHGERTRWLCELPPSQAKTEFRVGRAVEVSFVEQELKSALEGKSNETKITVSIALA